MKLKRRSGQTIQNLGQGHTNDDMLFIVANCYLLQIFFGMWPQTFANLL